MAESELQTADNEIFLVKLKQCALLSQLFARSLLLLTLGEGATILPMDVVCNAYSSISLAELICFESCKVGPLCAVPHRKHFCRKCKVWTLTILPQTARRFGQHKNGNKKKLNSNFVHFFNHMTQR